MNLSGLPVEIILVIADFLENSWEPNAFAQTNRVLYSLLSGHVYQHNIRYLHGSILAWAAKQGPEVIACKAMNVGADPMTCHDGKRTAMILAAYHGQATLLRLFLERENAPMQILTGCHSLKTDYNPLMLAAKNGHESVVRLLLEHGAIATGQSYETPLVSAVNGKYFAVVKVLADAVRANPPENMVSLVGTGCRDNYGSDTSHAIDLYEHLLHAAESGHVECVRLLLARGADPSERICENEDLVTNPAYSAIAEGNIEVAKLMLEHTDFDSLQKQNAPFAADEQDSLLYMALGAGSKYHVEVALERGMQLKMVTYDIHTDVAAPKAYDGGPFEVAAQRGDMEIMRTLLGWFKGLNLDIQEISTRGRNPLCVASYEGHLPMVKLLLEAGFNPDIADDLASFPLFSAVEHRHIQVVA